MIIRVQAPVGMTLPTEDDVRRALIEVDLGESEVKMSRSVEGEDILIRVKEGVRFRPPEAIIRNELEQNIQDQYTLIPDEQLQRANLPDFAGRTHLSIQTRVAKDKLIEILRNTEIDNLELVPHFTTSGDSILIVLAEGRDAASKVRRTLDNNYPEFGFEVRSIDRVGPRIGAELRTQAMLAILATLALVVIYLWWRFQLVFGLGAVIALFHDVLIAIGLFTVLNLEISITIIGAFLTLVGYSLNDTIVVYDRIRENIKRYKDDRIEAVINRSINDTLSRTIITGLTTLFVVSVLFFAGGEVLHNFAFALIVGIFVGTYSSIFIASPILVEWYNRAGKKNQMVKQKKR